jgi:hypothetical protein
VGLSFSPVPFLLVCILLILGRGVVWLGCWWSFCVFRCHSTQFGDRQVSTLVLISLYGVTCFDNSVSLSGKH